MGSCLEVGAALRRVLEVGNNDRSRAFASGQLVDGSWLACHGKSELLAALLSCSVMITHDSMSCCAQQCRVGWLASGVLFGIPSSSSFVHNNLFRLN